MLIATRFGLGIRDPAWFEHRAFLLSSITAPSLLAQDDHRFEWVVFVDAGLPEEVRVKLEGTLAPFEGRAYMDSGGHQAENLLDIAVRQELVSADGYVLTGRIDDDDAWDRRTINSVRDRIAAWRNNGAPTRGFCMTFKSGLVWIMYDMLDVHRFQKDGSKVICEASVRPYTYPFTSISGFVYARLSDRLTSISTGHPVLGDFLAERGFSVESLATDQPMWLYCRHKQTTSPIRRSVEANTVDWTLVDLEGRFGIDATGAQQYITNAYSYYYSQIGHWEYRSKVRIELKEMARKIADPRTSDIEAAALRHEHRMLSERLEDLSKKVTSDLKDTGELQV